MNIRWDEIGAIASQVALMQEQDILGDDEFSLHIQDWAKNKIEELLKNECN